MVEPLKVVVGGGWRFGGRQIRGQGDTLRVRAQNKGALRTVVHSVLSV